MNSLALFAILLIGFNGAIGEKIKDSVGSCNHKDSPKYYTPPVATLTNPSPACASQCLIRLSKKQEWDIFWRGCVKARSCYDECYCTLDSDLIVQGLATFKDAVSALNIATQNYKAIYAERYEGTMYVSYDCRKREGGYLVPQDDVPYDNFRPHNPNRQKSSRIFHYWRK